MVEVNCPIGLLIKPENFFLFSKDENAMLKATDFGLSVFIGEVENAIHTTLLVIRYM